MRTRVPAAASGAAEPRGNSNGADGGRGSHERQKSKHALINGAKGSLIFSIPGQPSANHLPLLAHLVKTPYFRITAALLLFLVVVAFSVSDKTKHRYESAMIERVEQGKAIPPHWYVPSWMWKGLLANVGLAALLVVASPWATKKVVPVEAPRNKPLSKWEWGVLALVVGIAAVQNAPRLSHSLWGDEEYTMKKLIAPQATRAESGELVFKEQTWATTFWSFRKPTNHIGYTVVARVFHDTFFSPTKGPTDPWFSELWIRMPVYLAGLLSIPALVWACWVWGLRGGLVLIAFVYSQHAWFMRFGVDARGYGFVLLFVPLLIGIAGRALQAGRWRWWLAFAFAEFFVFWAYFGVVYFLVALNGAVLLTLALRKSVGLGDRLAVLTRWLVASMVAGMLVIALMAPCLPQLIEFLAQKPLAGKMDGMWFLDAACYLMSGIPWQPWDANNPLCTAWAHSSTWPLMFPFAAVVLVVATLVGFGMGVMRLGLDPEKRWLLVVILGAPVLMIVHQWSSGILPYHWYLLPYLPGGFFVVAAGLSSLDLTQKRVSVSAMAAVAVSILIAQVAARERQFLAAHPIEPCRESVALTRKISNPYHPDYDKGVITAGFSFYTEAYDPGTIEFADAEGLRQLMKKAAAEGKDLFVNFGFREWADLHFADVMAVLDDANQFEHCATLPGMFLASTREVYRFKPPQR